MNQPTLRLGASLATIVVAAAGLSATPAQAAAPHPQAQHGNAHPWNARHGAGTSWFKDPLSKAQRRAEIAIPAGPQRFNGTAKQATVATLRTHGGRLAVPASMAYGHQLVKGQALTFNAGSLFKVSSAALTPHALRVVTRLAYSMSDVTTVACEGYADFGHHGLHVNKRLSTRRARSLCAALAAQTDLTTKAHGYGSSRPAVIGSTNPYRNANRRVVLIVRKNAISPAPVITDGSSVPDYDNGVWEFDMVWTTPASDGGSPLTGYEWSLDGSSWTSFGGYTTSGSSNAGVFETTISLCDTGSQAVYIRAVDGEGPGPSSEPGYVSYGIGPGFRPAAVPARRC